MSKKVFLLSSIVTVFTLFNSLTTVKAEISITHNDLYNNLKGKIILQVEANGEAYYISPDKQKMYFLSRPAIAFEVMREQGVGITNSNLEKIPVADNYCPSYLPNCDNSGVHSADFANMQKGKIFLQVEESGEAWYVDPSNSQRYFLGRPTDAFNVMRNLGLGISDGDFEKMTIVSNTDWKIYSHPLVGWTMSYPENWNYKEFNKSVGFAPSSIAIEYEATSHITFVLHQNPENLSLENFFKQANQIHYFEQATGGIEEITVANINSKKIKGIGGMLGSNTVILIPKEELIIEFLDSGDRHQSDEIFNNIVKSLKF